MTDSEPPTQSGSADEATLVGGITDSEPRTVSAPIHAPLRPASSRPDSMLAPLPASLEPRFSAEEELGRGGMGVVYRVRDRQLGRDAALKLILRPDAQHVALFEHEARVLATLEHDNIVRVYEFGLASGLPYLIMELVRGRSLAARLSTGRPLVAEAVRLGLEIAAAVQAAHEHEIAHLDLKPANVFLESSGRAKVADFGLSRIVRRSGAEDNLGCGGTPGYMPPEQWTGSPGLHSDVYALGVMLHELLTGRRLFSPAGRTFDAYRAAQRIPPAPPSETNPSVPGTLDELVLACLALEPSARPSIHAVRRTLADWQERVQRTGGNPGAAGFPPQPYKFLAHFGTQDTRIYFGRDAEVTELAQLIDNRDLRLVQVFGPCGIGKSSLLRAGLAAHLEGSPVRLVVLVSGPDPAERLRVAMDSNPDARTVVILDQAEEVFTLNPRGSARISDLFETLVRVCEQPTPVTIVLGYRTEFRGEFLPLEQRLGRVQHAFGLGEIGERGLVDAIEGPARIEHYRFSFEAGLPAVLASEILAVAQKRGDAALPAAQIICHQLHAAMRRTGSARIDAALYRDVLGGAAGALQRYVTDRLKSASYRDRGGIARRMLRALTLKEEGQDRYACPRSEEELLDFPDPDAARRTLDALIADRLVVSEEGPTGRRQVRLASEVICPEIERWREEPDDAERAAEALARGHRAWTDRGGSEEDLLWGSKLSLVEEQAAALHGLTPAQREFLARSQERRDREQRARRRRTTALVVFFAALATVAVAMGLRSERNARAAVMAQGEAERNAALARSSEGKAVLREKEARENAAETRRALSASDFFRADDLLATGKPQDALSYLARALRHDPSNPASGRRILMLLQQHPWFFPVAGPPPPAALSRAAVTRLEKVLDRARKDRRVATLGKVEAAAPVPGRSDLVVVGGYHDEYSQRGYLATPAAVHSLRDRGLAVAVSPDSALVVTICEGGIGQLWGLSGQCYGELDVKAQDDRGAVATITFSADGQRLGIGGAAFAMIQRPPVSRRPGEDPADGIDAARGAARPPRGGPSPSDPRKVPASGSFPDRVCSLARHPDGRRVLLGFLERAVQLWDLAEGVAIGRRLEMPEQDTAVYFSPDGSYFVTRSVDSGVGNGTYQLWDTLTQRALTAPIPVSQILGVNRCSEDCIAGDVVFVGDYRVLLMAKNDERISCSQYISIDLPPAAQPAPLWVADLAEAVGGRRLDAANAVVVLDARERRGVLERVRRSASAGTGGDRWASVVQWLLDHSSDRVTAPGSSLKVRNRRQSPAVSSPGEPETSGSESDEANRTPPSAATPVAEEPYEKRLDVNLAAAMVGNPEAQYEVADRYRTGRGVPKNEREAARWYLQAAKQGHLDAQRQAGFCYVTGTGVEKNYAQAVHWSRIAADRGSAPAMYNLGRCYQFGLGVPKDLARARQLWARAAGKAHADARKALSELDGNK